MDPKKSQVKDLALDAFQDEQIQEMFGNLMTQCQRHEGITEDTVRDLLLDLVVESYMLSNIRKNLASECAASESWCSLETSSNTDPSMQKLHNTNISNNKQQNLTTPGLPSVSEEVSKESAAITDVHDAIDESVTNSCESHSQIASGEGSIYRRILSALRLAKKEHIATDYCPEAFKTPEHIPRDSPEDMSNLDDKLRKIWVRMSDPSSDSTSSTRNAMNEFSAVGVKVDTNSATHHGTCADGSEGFVCDEEPSPQYKNFMSEMQEVIGNKKSVAKSDDESDLDEYESASDYEVDLATSRSDEHMSLSRASSSSFLTASDHLDEAVADLEEEVVCVKTIRPQFLGKYYLQRLANARKTAAEIKARKPDPRVKLDKPCRLDTNLTYAVRQSLRRSLPLIAGKNKLSALMMMADGMFDEMSLDRDLDDLAWPFDPLADLRKSGLAMVDYMDPHPTGSATLNTSNMKEQSSPSECVPYSMAQHSAETLESGDLLNLTYSTSSGQSSNIDASDPVVAGPLVSFSPKAGTVSSVSKESPRSVTSLRFLFKPLKSMIDSILDTDPFRVLVNHIQRCPTDEVSKIQLLPQLLTQNSLVQISDQPHKLHLSTSDDTKLDTINAMSGSSTVEMRSSGATCYSCDDREDGEEFSPTFELMKETRPQFLGTFYLNRLADARQTVSEISAMTQEPGVKTEKPFRLDTNLVHAIHPSLKISLPLIAGKSNLSALIMMADGMFDEMHLDRDVDDLAWPYDSLAEMRKSGLAMADYPEPCTSVDLPISRTSFDLKDEITSAAISPSGMGNNLLPEDSDSESKNVEKITTNNCSLSSKQAATESLGDRKSATNHHLPTSLHYPAALPPPSTVVTPSDKAVGNYKGCLDLVSNHCGQIAVPLSDSIINTADVTTRLPPFEMCPPLKKEDDHQSIDSALGEDDSAASFDRDDDEDKRDIISCTHTNLHLNNHEETTAVPIKSLSPLSIGGGPVSSPAIAGTVSSNIQIFEQLAKDGRECPQKSIKLVSSSTLMKPTISEDIRKRADLFESVDVCRPLTTAKQTFHSSKEDNFDSVNIKTQVAMFEKLLVANITS